MTGLSKRVRWDDRDYEETLQKWHDEDRDSGSDRDNVLEDTNIESEQDTVSELSESDEPVESDELELSHSKKTYIHGRNRYRWRTSEVRPSSRTRKQHCNKSSHFSKSENAPLSIWEMLLSDHILEHIEQNSSKKLRAMGEKYSAELKAFLGLLVYSAIFNSSHENRPFIRS